MAQTGAQTAASTAADGGRSSTVQHGPPVRVRVIGSNPRRGAVTEGTPLRNVLSLPISTLPRQPGRENRAQSR
eukprot:364630-Chlamydomonas_euryale.AAC.1